MSAVSGVHVSQPAEAREPASIEDMSDHSQHFAVNTHPYFNFWNMFMLQPNNQFAGIVYLNPLQTLQWAGETFSPHYNDLSTVILREGS